VHRLLENEEITPEDVLTLRDSLKYYLEQNQSPDFVFDDAMYDELPMEKLDAKVGEELTSCESCDSRDLLRKKTYFQTEVCLAKW
jgi:CCR4-NOT transcription complex subunit 3